MSSFGERLLEAFGDVPKGKIAKILGVKPSAVTNYLQDRVPDEEKLRRISDETKCSIHWLLTGEGNKFIETEKDEEIELLGINFDGLPPSKKKRAKPFIEMLNREIERIAQEPD